MKKTIKNLAFWTGILILFISLLVFNISVNKRSEMSSISRPYIEDQYIVIDDSPVPLSFSFEEDSLEMLTLAQINDIRQEAGLKTLIYSDGLTQAALIRAKECEALFSHTRPNGMDWYTVNPAMMYGENLSEGYNDATSLTNAWMNSPTHRELIMDREYSSCGICSYRGANGVTYVACEFGY